ncbi:hypothetical protein HSUHS5_0690 [Helicobacter suis HS5]|uniref:VirB7 type IV secretion protein n=1 Tax=Helicobacter suis HS5 TaxID=710394 RepID=E7G3Z8_9HELI|nr:hypothetical protein HSUHS5_0690 [Helicobacter suis HS5]EFX42750.1 hypothetical protein HSUHS1_0962 [Helicobacter suis HS1]CRF49684.1 hypothetical protein HHE03_13420 [Helicobacter heilmannii]
MRIRLGAILIIVFVLSACSEKRYEMLKSPCAVDQSYRINRLT